MISAFKRVATAPPALVGSGLRGLGWPAEALLRAAKALLEKGVTPPGVDPEHQKVRSASIVLAPDQAFKDAAREALRSRPGVAQATV